MKINWWLCPAILMATYVTFSYSNDISSTNVAFGTKFVYANFTGIFRFVFVTDAPKATVTFQANNNQATSFVVTQSTPYLKNYTMDIPTVIQINSDVEILLHLFLFEEDKIQSSSIIYPDRMLSTDYVVGGTINYWHANKSLLILATTSYDTNCYYIANSNDRAAPVALPSPLYFGYNDYNYDYTGTTFQCDKKIAIFYTLTAPLPGDCDYYDQTFEQLLPSKYLGTEHVLAPLSNKCKLDDKILCCVPVEEFDCAKCKQFFRVVAVNDNTNITSQSANSNNNFFLNAKEHKDLIFPESDVAWLTSDKPVVVLQFQTSANYSGNEDTAPVLTSVQPTSGYLSRYSFSSCHWPDFKSYVRIVVDTATKNLLTLDGQPFLTTDPGVPVPTTAMSTFKFQLPCGADLRKFVIEHPQGKPFGLMIFGWSDAYAVYLVHCYAAVGPTNRTFQRNFDEPESEEVVKPSSSWTKLRTVRYASLAGMAPAKPTVPPTMTVLNGTIVCTVGNAEYYSPRVVCDSDCCSGTPNLTFADLELRTEGCQQDVVREWTVTDACGQSSNATQHFTKQLLDLYEPPPPTVNLTDCDDLNNLALTGRPVLIEASRCNTTAKIDKLDEQIKPGLVKRTWTVLHNCGNTEIYYAQLIVCPPPCPPVFKSSMEKINLEVCHWSEKPKIPKPTVWQNPQCCEGKATLTFKDKLLSGNSCEKRYKRVWKAQNGCGTFSSKSQIIVVAKKLDQYKAHKEIYVKDCDKLAANTQRGKPVLTQDCGSTTGVKLWDEQQEKYFLRTWTITHKCNAQPTVIQQQVICNEDAKSPETPLDPDEPISVQSDIKDHKSGEHCGDKSADCSKNSHEFDHESFEILHIEHNDSDCDGYRC